MDSRKTPIWQVFFLFAFLSCGLFFAEKAGWIDNLRIFLETKVFGILEKNISSCQNETEQYKAKTISQNSKIDQLIAENLTLRKQLQAPLPPSYKFIPAQIAAINSDQNENMITIFAGSSDKIENNWPVVVENILIGKVVKIGAHVSTVRLISDKDSKIAVKTISGVKGLLTGENKSNLKTAIVQKILQSADINKDENIITSGEDGMPPDLLIGKVKEIASKPSAPFKEASVDLPLDLSKLTNVFVIKAE